LDSAFAFPQAWLWRLEMRLAWETEKFFFVLLFFPALDLEMGWARSSSVFVKQLATEWTWISWPTVSDVFGLESALVLP
jgi:hypothetical protein